MVLVLLQDAALVRYDGAGQGELAGLMPLTCLVLPLLAKAVGHCLTAFLFEAVSVNLEQLLYKTQLQGEL
jgi:hypothetical protein